MQDGIIIGGGVIGLSLAWELARRGQQITVLDRQQIGREASWAGAGILPAAGEHGSAHPLEQLRVKAHLLHGEWAAKLQKQTGINTGYQRRGGIYVARTAGETAALIAQLEEWQTDGVACEELSLEKLTELEPGLQPLKDSGQLRAAAFLPGEGQLRNPRYLKALQAACEKLGVQLIADCEVDDVDAETNDHVSVTACERKFAARYCCLCGGAWTVNLLKTLGQASGILPIRGQMLLYKTDSPLITRVINEGNRYLVPRDDGHLLVGSCEEEVGFQIETSEAVVEELRGLAQGILPQLEHAILVKSWAGLRPGSFDTFPYMGKLPGKKHVFVSAGHFRHGLHLSPAAAVVMADLILEERVGIELQPLRVGRG
jgi:glycine oxidase